MPEEYCVLTVERAGTFHSVNMFFTLPFALEEQYRKACSLNTGNMQLFTVVVEHSSNQGTSIIRRYVYLLMATKQASSCK